MAKRPKKQKPKLVPKAKPIPLRPENDPDTVLESCKGCFESVLVMGYGKDGYVKDAYTENLSEADVNMLIDQYKMWLFIEEED